MPADNITFLKSTNITSVGTTYGEWSSGDMYEELLVYLELTDQGAYIDETLDITVQVRDHDGGAYDIASFDQITDKANYLITHANYRVSLPIKWFGTQCRIKVVTNGTSVDYTLKILGHLKRT